MQRWEEGKAQEAYIVFAYARVGDEAISIPNGQALPLGAVATAPQDPLSITSATIATQQAAGLEALALAGAEQSEILVT